MIRNTSTTFKRESNKHIKSDFDMAPTQKKQQYLNKTNKQKGKNSRDHLNQSPHFVRSNSQLLYKGKKEWRQGNGEKSGNIIDYLDEKDSNHIHKYKQLKNHSKNSDPKEVTAIIQELLNKHAIQRKLSISEQYILTGYMGKFVELAKVKQTNINNPFNINERIQTKNSINSAQRSQSEYFKTSRSPSKRKSTKKVSVVDEKKGVLNKQFERIKFLWQMYQLKAIVCPQINKISEFSEADYHRSMTEIVVKLKGIERNKSKVGQQKSLNELQKVMRSFQQAVRRGLC